MTKRCPGCDRDLPLDAFSKASRGGQGRAYRCRPCAARVRREKYAEASSAEQRAADAERALAWRNANIEKARESSRRQYRKDPAAFVKRTREWAKANPERAAEFQQKYRGSDRYRAVARLHAENRRARKAAVRCDFTAEQWEQVKVEFHGRCGYCLASVPLTQDHVVPISRGGDHTYDNIVPACQSCNSRKHARGVLQFLMMET